MNQKDIDKFRQQLLDLRVELQGLEETMEEAGKTVELDQARVGRLSRMDAMQGQQMALEAGRRRHQQLVDIEAALHRIDSGNFGFCLECGEEIDVRRLQVDPGNTRCIDCADKE
jgi:DnaK suppressor protein